MKTATPPQITCRRLSPFDAEDWQSIASAFAEAESCYLRQAWRGEAEPGFRPCCVRTGWNDAALLIYAELEDEDIHNPTTELNAFSYMHGDVFEMFLRPVEQSAYFEFHVSPQNQKLQLRFPEEHALSKMRAQGKGLPADWRISGWMINTRVKVCAGESKWRVFAEIPFEKVAEVRRPEPGSEWLFSFSRYDYTRGIKEPVLSSSSGHSELNFHRQQDWGVLHFAP